MGLAVLAATRNNLEQQVLSKTAGGKKDIRIWRFKHWGRGVANTNRGLHSSQGHGIKEEVEGTEPGQSREGGGETEYRPQTSPIFHGPVGVGGMGETCWLSGQSQGLVTGARGTGERGYKPLTPPVVSQCLSVPVPLPTARTIFFPLQSPGRTPGACPGAGISIKNVEEQDSEAGVGGCSRVSGPMINKARAQGSPDGEKLHFREGRGLPTV